MTIIRHLPVTLDRIERIEQFEASALLATPIGSILHPSTKTQLPFDIVQVSKIINMASI
jgi:hypothetical protein